jgi:hypothetical protein
VRLRIGDHRAQLVFADGAVIVTELGEGSGASRMHVRVDDADAHHARAAQPGAKILNPPTD